MTIKPLIQPIIRPIVGESAPSAVARSFAFGDGVDNYISLPPVTASGDFEWSCIFSSSDSAVQSLAGGDNDSFSNFITLFTGDTLLIRIGGASLSFSSTSLRDGQLHALEIARVSGAVTATLDGVALSGGGSTTNTFSIAQIFSNNAPANFFNGPIANVNFISGWQDSNGNAANHFYRIDDTDGILRSDATLGDELLINGDFNSSAGWDLGGGATIANGQLTLSSQTGSRAQRDINDTANAAYLVEYTITQKTGSAANLFLSSSGFGDVTQLIPDTVGTHQILVTSLQPTQPFRIITGGSGNSYIFSNISVKEAPGYGTYENFQASDIRQFTQNDDGDWLGDELAEMTSTGILGDAGNLEFATIVSSVNQVAGRRYRTAATISQVTGTPTEASGWSSGGGIPGAPPFRGTGSDLTVGSVFGGDFGPSTSGSLRLFGRSQSRVAYNEITVRELLETA